MDVVEALGVLREAQGDGPTRWAGAGVDMEVPSSKGGALKQRNAGASLGLAARQREHEEFQMAERHVAAAVQSLVAALQRDALSVCEALLALRAGIGVSEDVVSKSLRVLASKLAAPAAPDAAVLREVPELALVVLTRHRDNVDVCTSSLQALSVVLPLVPRIALTSTVAETIVGVMQEYIGCQALQRYGFALFAATLTEGGEAAAAVAVAVGDGDEGVPAFSLKGGGLARILTRIGVADIALVAVGRHPGDANLVVDACRVMQSLALASREVKLLLAAGESAKQWVGVLNEARPGDAVALATLRMLASLVTDDPELQNAAGSAPGLFEALEHRLSSGDQTGATGLETDTAEAAEIFGLLCRLTARHAENKQRCLRPGILQRTVERCRLGAGGGRALAARLAAGGLLVNLCRDEGGRQGALEAGARDAARVLKDCDGNLRRCGMALEQLIVKGSHEDASRSRPADPERPSCGSAFDGLFATRRSVASPSSELSGSDGAAFDTRRSVVSPGSDGGVPGAKGGTAPQAGQAAHSLQLASFGGSTASRDDHIGCSSSSSSRAAPAKPPVKPPQQQQQQQRQMQQLRPRGPGFHRLPRRSVAKDPAADDFREDEQDDGGFLGEWVPTGFAARPEPHDLVLPKAPEAHVLGDTELQSKQQFSDEETFSPQPQAKSPRFNEFWGDFETELVSHVDPEKRRPLRDPGRSIKGTEDMRGKLAEVRTELRHESAQRTDCASATAAGGRQPAGSPGSSELDGGPVARDGAASDADAASLAAAGVW
mmetsp:Transcript_10853/g.38078  ORF Transcript_10853/g.38078 Transcript_10853/m.38078 type:complete len:775 (+) Transcript_10853:650-2974(+)